MLSLRRDAFAVSAAVFIGAVTLTGAAAPRAVRNRLPDRLADSTFWRIVTTFSEPDGRFPSENFVSNEIEWQTVIPAALDRIKTADAYIGVGPEQNFTYIAAFHPHIAFICDIRRQNMIEHLMYKALIEMSRDRAGFLSMLWSRPRPEGLDASTDPGALVDAYGKVKADSSMYKFNLDAIFSRLVDQHKFALSSDDSATMRGVYDVFFADGPDVSYASSSGRAGAILPGVGPGGGNIVLPGGGGFIRFDMGRVSGSSYSYTITTDSLGRTVLMRDSAGTMVRDSSLRMQPNLTGLARFPIAGGMFPTFSSLMKEDDGAGVNRSWLGSESAFQSLKDFETRNLLIPVVGDFGGRKALRSIAKYLKDNEAHLSVFYTSNVEQYLFQNRIDADFYSNVSAMPTDSNSLFIRGFPPNNVRSVVLPRKTGALLTQTTSSIEAIVRAFQGDKLLSYMALAALQDRQ